MKQTSSKSQLSYYGQRRWHCPILRPSKHCCPASTRRSAWPTDLYGRKPAEMKVTARLSPPQQVSFTSCSSSSNNNGKWRSPPFSSWKLPDDKATNSAAAAAELSSAQGAAGGRGLLHEWPSNAIAFNLMATADGITRLTLSLQLESASPKEMLLHPLVDYG